jgi:hypothetical protein
MVEEELETQVCWNCGEEKYLGAFVKAKGRKRNEQCKACVTAARKGIIAGDLLLKKANDKRKAALKRATPPWITKEQIAEIRTMRKVAAENNMVVDHIVPLQGKNVSGLNVPWNMRIISWDENSYKHNKYE